MNKGNVIGAVVASFAFLFVIFAGSLGQLFTLGGSTEVPAYGTAAAPHGWSGGYADPLTYDAKGTLVDFRTVSGTISHAKSATDETCRDRTYVYTLKDMKIWKKGSKLAALETALHEHIDPLLKACAPSAGEDFSCEKGCVAKDEDAVINAKPLAYTLISANASGPGMLQYVFNVNAGCIRVRHCVASGL